MKTKPHFCTCKEKADSYCVSCDQNLCIKCFTKLHLNHKTLTLKQREDLINNLTRTLTELAFIKEGINSKIDIQTCLVPIWRGEFEKCFDWINQQNKKFEASSFIGLACVRLFTTNFFSRFVNEELQKIDIYSKEFKNYFEADKAFYEWLLNRNNMSQINEYIREI